MAHRETIKAYLKEIKIPDGAQVVDWGRGTKPITKYISGNYKYFGIDKLDHVGADLVGDITLLNPRIMADVAFCMEVLEHVQRPGDVLFNIMRFLRSGGEFYFSVPFLYPVHSEEDYWRFTDQGMRLLLEGSGFDVIEILPTENNMGWVGKAVKLSTF